MPLEIKFRKTGKEIRESVAKRIEQLKSRLEHRNAELEKLMGNKAKLRSYLIRSTQAEFYGHGRAPSQLYSKDDISSEEKEETRQMCKRIFEIEQEIETRFKIDLDPDKVEEACNNLVSNGILEKKS